MMFMAIFGIVIWAALFAGAWCISYWCVEAVWETVEDLVTDIVADAKGMWL